MKVAMKVAKPMKVMKKAMKVSVIAKGRGAKARVFKGLKDKTVGGLTKASLTTSKGGKVVSKAASARGKKAWATSALKKWADASKQARKEMGITGFCQLVARHPRVRPCTPR